MANFPEEGFLYVVYGKSRFFREAQTSLESLRRVDPDAHVTLVTDRVIGNLDAYDHVILNGDLVPHKRSQDFVDGKFEGKIAGLPLTPYTRTLFVDCDTYFLDSVRGLFRLLDWYDMALLPKSGEANVKDPVAPHGRVEGHTPYNTGVILYQMNEDTDKVFTRWKRYYRQQRPIQRSRNDQAYFLLAVAKSRVTIHPLPANYNARIMGYLGLTGKVRVLHMAGGRGLKKDEYEAIGREINRRTDNRGWNASTRTLA